MMKWLHRWPSRPLHVCEFSEGVVRVLVYRHAGEGEDIEVLGFAECANPGYRQGRFGSLSDSTESLTAAWEKAVRKPVHGLPAVAMNLDDPQMESVKAMGSTRLGKGEDSFQARHLREARDRARALVKPSDKHLVYCREAGFVIDGKHPVADPVGVLGKELTVILHLLFVDSYHVHSLRSIAERAGIILKGFYPSGLAAMRGVAGPSPEKGQVLILERPYACHLVCARLGVISDCFSTIREAGDGDPCPGIRSFIDEVDPDRESTVLLCGTNGTGLDPKRMMQLLERRCLRAKTRISDERFQDPSFAVLVGLAYLHKRRLGPVPSFHAARSGWGRSRRRIRAFLEEYF